ncbi:thermonuclease family protein [Zobellella denitrificans]|uniref:thermonuclease family protein n=1 Tax=Zobellella denitrificans TaxID=347534 RepID=UPI000BBF31F7|nr:thermonuclease family protein [Zobellella denitrificans]
MSRWKYILVLLCWPPVAVAGCPHLQPDEEVLVRHVIDGDTVILKDGRVIRFIGVDAPELNKHNNGLPEFGAEAARDWLVNKIVKQSQLKLVFGVKRRDDYGRWLAHPLTSEGELLVTQMLTQGLGRLMLFPPNHDYWPCWLEAERQARRSRRGIWSIPLAATPVAAGWQQLSGLVVRGISGRGRLELVLEGELRIRAGKRLPSEARHRLALLGPGDRLFVRGWVRPAGNGWQLWLNHPWQFYQEKVSDCAGQC